MPEFCREPVNMFHFLDNCKSMQSFAGHTLVLPAISVGNVGQLTCDLLISTLDLKKVGYFNPQFFLPIIGNNPFASSKEDQCQLCLNCEVYSCFQKHITVLQIRSPLIKSKQDNFRKTLLEWITKCNFSELIILSSCHSYERTDEQLLGTPFRYLLSPAAEKNVSDFDSLNWKRLEERNTGHGDRSLFIPGGGYTKTLFNECCTTDIPTTVLLVFCAEGDNIPEAIILASRLHQWKPSFNESEKWKPPSSWVHLFGNNPPSELF